MAQVMSVRSFNNISALFNKCRSVKRPLFLREEGCEDVVIMSKSAYDDMILGMDIDECIAASEREEELGIEPLDARTVLADLRRKYFG